MHIYAFGSISRGEIQKDSDIDLLAIVDGYNDRLDLNSFSIYSYSRIREIWHEGNPFSWHLYLEGKPIFLEDSHDFLQGLGAPSPYSNTKNDCAKFYSIFEEAIISLQTSKDSCTLDLSTVFLSIRNFATCYSMTYAVKPDFSRNSALRLGNNSLDLPEDIYQIFERSRLLCTRGYGEKLSNLEISCALNSLLTVKNWMRKLLKEIE